MKKHKTNVLLSYDPTRYSPGLKATNILFHSRFDSEHERDLTVSVTQPLVDLTLVPFHQAE